MFAILCRIAQRLRYGSLFFRQGPDDAFTRRNNVWLRCKYRISECFLGINRLPSLCLEHRNQVAEEKSIQKIEVHQDGMLHRTTQHTVSERIVVLSARPHVLEVEIAIGYQVGSRILF